MLTSLSKLCLGTAINSNLAYIVRHGHRIRGKPPGVAKTMQQRFEEWNWKDPEIHFRVDIGLPPTVVSRKEQLNDRLQLVKQNRRNPELEYASRHKKLEVDLEKVKKEWESSYGQQQIRTIADHYGVFQDLFGDAYFNPRVPLTILYNYNDEYSLPVYYGNVIKPTDATKKPDVQFEDNKSFWTLILTNPDGHFTEQNSEYVHWFVGNIPGNDVSKGETVVEYLQPFPPKGTGYHRHIFILYKHDKPLDYSPLKREGACLNLSDRTFKTLDFYRERQDFLTPAGLAFFQCDWDKSLHDFYHKTLKLKEPVYEYDFPPPYIRPQEWFPLRKPFNIYMDKYRDPKQINKEFLVHKLKNIHPFRPDRKPLPFPNAIYPEGYVPTWLQLEKEKGRLKWGRINEIE